MNKKNYQKELDKIIEGIGADAECAPTLFLHSCCAPCSSYVLEYLRKYFRITVFYYNPNITGSEEYYKRVAEQKRLIEAYNAELAKQESTSVEQSVELAKQESTSVEQSVELVQQESASAEQSVELAKQEQTSSAYPVKGYPIEVIEGDYEPERFFEIAKGLEQCPEGGERCFACYALRLGETARRAGMGGYDYFTTTLSISPLKNAAKLNEIGEKLAQEYGVAWLPSDFKKRDGYKRSIELSKEYGLYRQDYCGCAYSRRF